MACNSKPLPTPLEGDRQDLRASQVREGQTSAFARTLPGRSDSAKQEVLAEVSSVANAAGGHPLFGMDDTVGIVASLGVLSVKCSVARMNPFNLAQGVIPRNHTLRQETTGRGWRRSSVTSS